MKQLGEHRFSEAVTQLWQVRYYLAVTMIGFGLLLWMQWSPLITFVLSVLLMLVLAAALLKPRGEAKLKAVSSSRKGRLSGISGADLAELLSDPLIIFDDSSRVLYANQAALTGLPALERGTALYMRFRAPEMHGLFQAIIAGGGAQSIDYFERPPVDRWYKAMVMRLSDGADGAGQPKLFMLMFRDQTETRRIDRMRTDFIANASHELRTPLASLRGFIETLQGPARNDAAARERFLEIMQQQADRMSRLIDDLLSLSRLEMRAHPGVNETVDLFAILNHVVDSLMPLAQAEGIVIERRFPDKVFKTAGSRDELIQVFQNLVENACKYGQSGKKIIISVEEIIAIDHPEAVISVQDFGPGIESQHLPRLTERFYRVDVENSRSHKGTGLGLAIAKHILVRHRGQLGVHSRPGEGTTFTVRLNLLSNGSML